MITPTGDADLRHAFVRSAVIRSVLIVTITATGAAVALAAFADHQDIVIRAAFAIGGALLALTALNSFASYVYGASGASWQRAPQRGTERSWPGELLEIEARVSLARVSAFDNQTRLRPLLRELAARRLDANRHLDIDRQADQARKVLGAELWDEVQPLAPSRDLRDSPGPTSAAIKRLVDKIESI